MFNLRNLASGLFGSANERAIRAYREKIIPINDLEGEMSSLGDEQLQAYTPMLRHRIEHGESLDEVLVPAFAVVREAAKRVFEQRHFDVQLIGGMVLHEGRIAEMRTGEGKTLVATLAVYLNALTGKGVHVVTVNDYLAQRDAMWMSQIYEFLGLSVGVISHDMDDIQRRAAYTCDITYCTNNELGFDYLRDNMKYDLDQMVQRGHNFAIVDEVDSILIDEARTPLIISGALDDKTDFYIKVDELLPKLEVNTHFEINEKNRTVILTEAGNGYLEDILREAGLLRGDSMYDMENVSLVHHIDKALKAHKIFQRDRDYIVKDESIVIVDEFTGRMMPGRRYSDGLHQAIEAKERVTIQPENQTLASITFQNYFRLYNKLSGMTGTAATEANEFKEIYNLSLIAIPTNVLVDRIDDDDEVYRTAEEKCEAIIDLIEECYERSQPVLVGTASIANSELLAEMLEKRGFKQRNSPILCDNQEDDKQKVFQVLNARYHEQEAFIIAQAGVAGAITVATNMAGRGTDIRLGGNADMRIQRELPDMEAGPEYDRAVSVIRAEVEASKRKTIEAGGLYVIGTERHESRRIDNQLRGRSGRQGDPGHSRFFISLEDDLMRIFGPHRMDSMLGKLGLQRGEAIIHPWINKALENAQRKVEARNFDVRKNLLKFDDVMNDQRKVIFEQRIHLIEGKNIRETIEDMCHETVDVIMNLYAPHSSYAEQWDVTGIKESVKRIFDLDIPVDDWSLEEGITREQICSRLIDETDKAYSLKLSHVDPGVILRIEKMVLLQMLDNLWRDHLLTLDNLRQVVGLRGYGQRDPLNEYKTEAFALFECMLENLREMVISQLMHGQFFQDQESQELNLLPIPMEASHTDSLEGSMHPMMFTEHEKWLFQQQETVGWGKVGRNALCPCNSGKKYKHCHGKL